MKGGSHRLPTSDPHEDWVDGSWTVDCVCGVNFDDGEEMVNCDECGVWVHTRCSCYVKSDKSFACDKCKSKNIASVRNESEETEVAQFLVELPTKTLRMDNPASVSSSRPFRLWTDIPREERVHVQGVPGGDPGLFSGTQMSSIFGPQLWKATGYAPKKFNFQYREFPWWNDDVHGEKKEVYKKSGDQNGNQVDDGAGVLYSLSKEKENNSPTPVVDSTGVKNPIDEGKQHGHELLSSKQMKWRSLVLPSTAHCGKHVKDEPVILKDQHAKKTAGKIEKEENFKKRSVRLSQAASTFSSDGKQLEFSEDRNSKVFNLDTQGSKIALVDQLSRVLCDTSTDIASREQSTFGNDSSGVAMPREDAGYQILARSEISVKINDGVASLVEHHDFQTNPLKEEVIVGDLESLRDIGVRTGSIGTGLHDIEPIAQDNAQFSNVESANSSQPVKKLKAEVDVDNHGCFNVRALSPYGFKLDSVRAAIQHPESSADLLSDRGKVTDNSTTGPEAIDHQVLDGDRMLDLCNSKDKTNQLQGDAKQSKQEPTGSEGSIGARQRLSGHKHGLKPVSDSSRSSGSVTTHSTTSYKRKVVASVGKSPSTSASVVISKSSDDHMPATNQNQYTGNRRKGISDSKVRSVKDNVSTNVVRDEKKHARLKKIIKEPPRSRSCVSKISQLAKSSDASDSKRAPSDSKDSTIHSSTKEPSMSHVFVTPDSGECASSQQTEILSNVQNKATDSALPLKGKKISQSGIQSSSRGNASLLHAPASSSVSALLSDEELALLLHQELNSSPRVPRIRHTGSLPQLTSTTATSMLMKQSSSSGGKDHGLGSRRKTKDFAKDLLGSQEVDDEAKRPCSHDNRKQDPGYNADSVSKRGADGGSVKGTHSMKTSNSAVSTADLNSSLSADDANGHNLSSIHHSPRNFSQEDQGMVGRPTNRTLPGLIAEIMSKGKRMTYEELCNAVLPHWPHLRKHNGERYAYSSHSQAVLDCLRNRSEWARLVDRGPKTSTSRKRRKIDTDSTSIESEDNGNNRSRNAKDVGSKSFESHQEDFPKGKRKARKRRRLALQGKGIVRRHRADVVSDGESESFSNASEDSMSSGEEIQGCGTSLAGNEASASSNEVR